MRKRPVVLVDVDGVICDFLGENLAWLRTVGIDIDRKDCKQWDFSGLGIHGEIEQRMKSRWYTPGLCASLIPYPGALECMRTLRAVADVYAVTAPMDRSVSWQGERMAWLVSRMEFKHDHVISTAAKHLIRGDIFVDDRTETVTKWCEHNDGMGVVWAQPYNEGYAGPGYRTGNWETLIRLAGV